MNYLWIPCFRLRLRWHWFMYETKCVLCLGCGVDIFMRFLKQKWNRSTRVKQKSSTATILVVGWTIWFLSSLVQNSLNHMKNFVASAREIESSILGWKFVTPTIYCNVAIQKLGQNQTLNSRSVNTPTFTRIMHTSHSLSMWIKATFELCHIVHTLCS